jgi:hypothetical protein
MIRLRTGCERSAGQREMGRPIQGWYCESIVSIMLTINTCIVVEFSATCLGVEVDGFWMQKVLVGLGSTIGGVSSIVLGLIARGGERARKRI